MSTNRWPQAGLIAIAVIGFAAPVPLLGQIDGPTRQVMIQARVLEVSRDSDNLGIRWGLNIGTVPIVPQNQPGATPTAMTNDDGGLNIFDRDVRFGGTFGKLFTDSDNLSVLLGSLEAQVDILSAPSLVTMDDGQAAITTGTFQPYFTVGLDVESQSWTSGQSSQRDTQTAVMAGVGSTVVLGGVLAESDQDNARKIPVLADIGLISSFFKSNTQTRLKVGLIVFITPRILVN